MERPALRRYDAILLDVGATLLEFRPEQRTRAWSEIIGATPESVDTAWRAVRSTARELVGYETPEEYEAFRAEVCSQTLEALGFDGDRHVSISAMSDAWVRVGWEPFPDVEPVLSDLHAAGYRLGVVSNWTSTLELTLTHVGLVEHFDVVACSALVGAMKPDPRIFQHALGALALQPTRALYVGDNYEVDVLGARDAGMDAVLIVRDQPADVRAESATMIRSLHELRALLDAS